MRAVRRAFKRNLLLIMSPIAHRAIAAKWFLIGFRLSGQNFNGERYDAVKYPSLRQLLLVEFNRVYDGERDDALSRENGGDVTGDTRGARSRVSG